MKTKIIHNRLDCYNLCNPKEKSESYIFIFDEENKETNTVTFHYDEANAPQLDVSEYSVTDLICELAGYPSTKWFFSSEYNHIGEKPHDERIEMALKLAEKNKIDDNRVFIEKLKKEKETLLGKSLKIQSIIDGLEAENE